MGLHIHRIGPGDEPQILAALRALGVDYDQGMVIAPSRALNLSWGTKRT